ncbi:MAG: hypothetical protein AB1505_22030 [Candidatus Latescibacterota bacterium]
MGVLLSLVLLLAVAGAGRADVYLVERVVNSGFGPGKTGARTTVNRIYVKGARQKVEADVSASEAAARALREQGQPLRSSTILRLDRDTVYVVDREAQTYVRQRIPPPAAKAARPAAGPESPVVRFDVEERPDTARVAGIRCRRIVARMQARYLDPKTGQPRRENRYVFDAWMAEGFPGFDELKAFQTQQRSETSYPPLISGGLEQLSQVAEDSVELAAQMEALQGFPLRSVLTVSVLRPGSTRATEVFRLEREVQSLEHSALPDSVFVPSRSLTEIRPE